MTHKLVYKIRSHFFCLDINLICIVGVFNVPFLNIVVTRVRNCIMVLMTWFLKFKRTAHYTRLDFDLRITNTITQ